MLIHLVKKDFLIVKKYVLIMLAVCILIPLFIAWKAPEQAGGFRVCFVGCLWCIYALAACFYERMSISKGICHALCCAISPKASCFVKIYFLLTDLSCVLLNFRDRNFYCFRIGRIAAGNVFVRFFGTCVIFERLFTGAVPIRVRKDEVLFYDDYYGITFYSALIAESDEWI